MGGRHNPCAADQGASAEVVARVQRDLVGQSVLLALIPSHNLVFLLHRSGICTKVRVRMQTERHQLRQNSSMQVSHSEREEDAHKEKVTDTHKSKQREPRESEPS